MERLFELRRTRRQAVILLVSVLDRRLVAALQFVCGLACSDARALHIAVDPVRTRLLAADWMRLDLTWLPLHVQEATAQSVPAAVRDAVRTVAGETDRVTVVIPELDFVRWWGRLVHRGGARRIAAELQTIPGVTAVIVPFCVRP